MEVAGRRIVVMGLGRHGGGVAAARWLANRGAIVTVTDVASAASLSTSVQELADVPIARWTFGRHNEADFVDADAVVVNPAVRPDHPLLESARLRGVRLTSEIELFLDRCLARVIGVTGSNGKSTTATMLAAMLKTTKRRTWLGGNIGVSLLGVLNRISADDFVVLELSSFQLAHLSEKAKFPSLAIVTNCTSNHLDWHSSFDTYSAAKRRLVDKLPAGGAVVMNANDDTLRTWTIGTVASVISPWPFDRVPPLRVPGGHNRSNAASAAALAEWLGASPAKIDRALRSFDGLRHRQQTIATIAGRRFVDDSKSTTPAATLAAIVACGTPAWLLIGGQNKGADFGPLFEQVADRVRGIAFFGQSGPALFQQAKKIAPRLTACCVAELNTAFDWCCQQSSPGEIILLSPGCASFDQFRDYEHRADQFAHCIDAWRGHSPRCYNDSAA